MAEQLLEPRDVSDQPFEGHLEPNEVAAYVDRAAHGGAKERIELHLAMCAHCREEVSDVARIISTLPRARVFRRSIWIPTTAAAAVLLMLVWPRTLREPGVQVTHREAPVTATVSPRALVPGGIVDSARTLIWTSVPHTDRYHVLLYDAEGSVLWDRETSDTTVTLPATVQLRIERSYFWKVEAHTGFDRKAASELTEFSLRPARKQ